MSLDKVAKVTGVFKGVVAISTLAIGGIVLGVAGSVTVITNGTFVQTPAGVQTGTLKMKTPGLSQVKV